MIIMVAMRVWNPNTLEEYASDIRKVLTVALEDRDPNVQKEARNALWAIYTSPKYHAMAEAMIKKLDLSSQKQTVVPSAPLLSLQ